MVRLSLPLSLLLSTAGVVTNVLAVSSNDNHVVFHPNSQRLLDNHDEDLKCYSGFVTDTFCINAGGFVDLPDIDPLVNPEEHTAICLVNPPPCQESYEILGAPSEAGGNYTRDVALGTDGSAMMVAFARLLGSGCEGCVGSQEKGIMATVVGKIANATADPPVLATEMILPNDVGCDFLTLEADFCTEGFVSDTFCINQGGFVDLPEIAPLVNPEEHTAKCLINPPQCHASYEILGEPEEEGGLYTRTVVLDKVGNALMLKYARELGTDCNECVGTQEKGIRATVFGKKMASTANDGTPPTLMVTKIMESSVGCAAFVNADDTGSSDSGDGSPSSGINAKKSVIGIVVFVGVSAMALTGGF